MPKKEIKKSVDDYYYYLGSAKQASDYETTTEFLINYIKKTFDYGSDIGRALKELKEVDTDPWKPTLNQSSDTDAAIQAIQNKQFEMEFKADYDAYRKRVLALENNKTKAYALFWERCAKGMKNKLESRVDFDTLENDPIELLKAIKQHALNYQEHRYDMSIIYDAITTLFGTKQKENESLQDYTKRFRVSRDVLESHMGGPIILTKVIEAMPGYDESIVSTRDKCRKDTYERFLAYMYLSNADKAKYGSILQGLNTQQSLHNDQYPKTVVDANNVLSNHKFDNYKSQARPSRKDKDKSDKNSNDDKEDKEEQEVPMSFAQLEGRCYCCGKPGHRSPDCREKDKIPREEWAINKVEASHVQASENANMNNNSSTGSQVQGSGNASQWAGVHLGFYQASAMRTCILLDNESSATIFCNPDMVTNIRQTDKELTLTTNAGVLQTKMKADVPGWGEVWFDPTAMTNIFSYAQMVDRHPVTYDSTKEDAFIVHLPHKQVKFTRENGLYVYRPPYIKQPAITKDDEVQCDNKVARDNDNKLQPARAHTSARNMVKYDNKVQFLETVDENKKFYTKRQFEQAKRARELLYSLGYPSINDMKAIIRMNAIKNNPVTTEDVDIAEKIFGPDVATLKGKTTCPAPVPVIEDRIETAKNGISQYYSPRMILHQRNLDYDKHCQYAFGTYVQAHDEPDPSNTNAPRTLDCIYLRYNDNEQGGHDLLHLQTNRMITRRRVTPIPITPAIIKMVHRIAEQDGMPKGLKITNRTGQVLYDSTWIAGVDYDEDKFEDEDYDPYSDEDEDSDDSDDDDDDDQDMYDEMDPDAIAALNDPTTLQDDEDSEDSDDEEQPQVEEPDDEEESEEESEEEQDPNPTTAEEQTIPENAQMTRSGRISKPRQVLNLYQSHLQAEAHQEVPYSIETARVIAVHKDMKSHTGATMTLGSGTICSISTKQKVNTRSSTEAKLVGFDDVVSKILWSKLFIEAQGFEVKANIVYRDNTSSMRLEENGKASSGKRTRHFHIKFFYITDLINRNEIQIKYCPTEDMIADYMTKPLVGVKFEHFRKLIMNLLSNTAITS